MKLSISLADNGKGIPESEIETLFEPFQRGTTDADGTGLGLNICRDLAQRMGGTLTCKRSAQGGAEFNFILTDIMMPNLDGSGLTRALRGKGYQKKIIGLKAATIGLETDQLLAEGADATHSKPVDINKLAALVSAPADGLPEFGSSVSRELP